MLCRQFILLKVLSKFTPVKSHSLSIFILQIIPLLDPPHVCKTDQKPRHPCVAVESTLLTFNGAYLRALPMLFHQVVVPGISAYSAKSAGHSIGPGATTQHGSLEKLLHKKNQTCHF